MTPLLVLFRFLAEVVAPMPELVELSERSPTLALETFDVMRPMPAPTKTHEAG